MTSTSALVTSCKAGEDKLHWTTTKATNTTTDETYISTKAFEHCNKFAEVKSFFTATAPTTPPPPKHGNANYNVGTSSNKSNGNNTAKKRLHAQLGTNVLSVNTNGAQGSKRFKRNTAVQRTHSPVASSPKGATLLFRNNVTGYELHIATPTVKGIHEVARHLIQDYQQRRPSQQQQQQQQLAISLGNNNSTSKLQRHSLVAMPTECTYELCTVVSWRKDETPTARSAAFRNDRLQQITACASPEPSTGVPQCPLHVYLSHDNIKQIGRLMDFPKRAYAVKQIPNEISTFHEGRLIFQRLADEFWPGPVLLYLPTTSSTSSPSSSPPPSPTANGTTKSSSSTMTTSIPEALQLVPPQDVLQLHSTPNSNVKYIGFRCPSHPLTVKVLKHIQRASGGSVAMVGSPVAKRESPSIIQQRQLQQNPDSKSNANKAKKLLVQAKEVVYQFSQAGLPSAASIGGQKSLKQQMKTPRASIQVLHGEEKRETFPVPPCQFRDEWLECWIIQESRTVVLRGKSRRSIPPQVLLRDAKAQNRVVRSVLGQWKVVDQRTAVATSTTAM